MIKNLAEFFAWESKTRDTIDFKVMYVDLAGDLIAGLLLSQIIYWHLPNKKGASKLRVFKDGKYWLAKKRSDWWKEVRVTERQYDTAIRKLIAKGLVKVKVYKFAGTPTPHINLVESALITGINEIVKSTSQNGEMDFDDCVKSITETTAENTTETTLKTVKGALLAAQGSRDDFELYEKVLRYYFGRYYEHTGNTHPALSKACCQRIAESLFVVDGCDVDAYDLLAMIDKHFETEYEDTDWNIMHFLSDGVKVRRMYEAKREARSEA